MADLTEYEIWWLAGRDRVWLDRYFDMHKGWEVWIPKNQNDK